MSGATGGALAAAIAAKRRRERMLKEENVMTKYNSDDLNGWEFKIVRSAFGSFRNLEKVQQLCTEEALSGWEMIEKFDNERIRFKRRVTMRSQDSLAETDPYRTDLGFSKERVKKLLLGGLFVLGGAILLYLQFADRM